MRQRLPLLAVAALAAVAVAGAAPAAAAPAEPVLYAAGQPIYPGVVYTGSLGNVEAVVR